MLRLYWDAQKHWDWDLRWCLKICWSFCENHDLNTGPQFSLVRPISNLPTIIIHHIGWFFVIVITGTSCHISLIVLELHILIVICHWFLRIMILADSACKNITNGRFKSTTVTELTVDMWSTSVSTGLWELFYVKFW